MYEPIITGFFDNEEEMAKFQKWREEQEEMKRLEKKDKEKKKTRTANVAQLIKPRQEFPLLRLNLFILL